MVESEENHRINKHKYTAYKWSRINGGCFTLFIGAPSLIYQRVLHRCSFVFVVPLPKINIARENRPGPKRKRHLPTIHFQGRSVGFRESSFSHSSIICAFRNVPRLLKLPLSQVFSLGKLISPTWISQKQRKGMAPTVHYLLRGLLYILLETSPNKRWRLKPSVDLPYDSQGWRWTGGQGWCNFSY